MARRANTPEDEAGDRARQAAAAAEALEPELGFAAWLDPFAFGSALLEAAVGAARNPGRTLEAGAKFAGELTAAGAAVVARALGVSAKGPVAPDPKDRRFADPAWEQNPLFFGLLQGYLLSARLLGEVVRVSGLSGNERRKAEFAARMLADALAPTNYLWTNPAALKRALDTGGHSLLRGLRNFLRDLAENGGLPRQVDRSAFEVGKDLAATPGKVVFRNELMELLQYAPQTETVFEIPLLLSPPWINKYYVMDLATGRSFAEWAVQHGHTVFAISYRNPDEALSQVPLDTYLLDGPLTALDVIAEITGSPKVNVVGLCVGGTLAAMLLAYLAAGRDARVRSATLLNTLIDFSEPGYLGCFVDPESVAFLEKRMAGRGYLDKREMQRTFNLLRANDLIWSYVASNWLMGEDPPAFDILAWNADSTRMPAAMHSFYLRSCYLENRLAGGELELGGRHLDLGKIGAEVYLLAAKEDHIAPWRASYAATQLLKRVRFVLSSSGHIAGIVNPPSPKRSYWVNERVPPEPDEWLAGAVERQGSWWEDWASWIEARAGERREPPQLGSEAHPPLGDAPGAYVLEQ